MRTTADAAPSPVETTLRGDAVVDAQGGSVRRTTGGWTANASRLVASVAIAFGVSIAFDQWLLAGRGLPGETDIVGYPTYANFNIRHYTQLFALAVVVFPVVLAVAYVTLGRVLPRVLDRVGSRVVVEGSGMAARLGVPGVALGLTGAVAAQVSARGVWIALALGVVGWASLAVVVAALLAARPPTRSFARRLALANMALVPLTVMGLAAVSAATEVTVRDTGLVEQHPFLPWPLAVLGALVVGGVVAHGARQIARRPLEDVRRREFAVVTLVAGSVIVFLVTARLPGALTWLDGFHDGERLATASLLRQGAFPWRDVLFIHGPLADGLWPMLGLSVFEDSWWGMTAGAQMLVTPLCYVLVWILLASIVRRNWVVLVGFVLVLLAADGFLGGALTNAPAMWAPRWALLPIVVLVLARTLSSQNRWWACGLGALLLVAFVLTPEFAFGVVAIGVALAGYEIVTGRGRPYFQRFRRTLWCFAGGVAAAAAFVTWLGLNGAVDDFVFYFRTFAPDHQLTGGRPINLPAQDAEFLFAAALPLALALMTGSYFAWRLSRRHPIRPADWAMGSLALLGVLYYPKFLSRADQHVFAGVVIGLPLLAYVGARLLEPGDRDLQRNAPGRAPRHALSAAAGVLLLTAVPPAVEHLGEVPSRFAPDVQAEKAIARLGYAAALDLPAGIVDDLEVAVQALGPDARLFDFTNQPGLVHYLLGLPSPTRYPHVSMAIREPNQADLIDELAADPPELVLYWSTNLLGLGAWDGIVNPVRHYDVSQWLLENYEPWFAIDGEVLYIRHDLDKPDPRGFADQLTVDPIIEDTAALLPACDWGTSPVFLDDDGQVATDGTTLNGTPIDRTATFEGHAGPVAGAPVTRVLAVARDGTVLSEGATTGDRPDLAAVAPGGVARGFAITVPLAAHERPEDVRIVAVSSDDVAASIGSGPVLVPGSHLAYSSGRTAIATSSRATGAIDGTAVTALAAGEGIVRFDLPQGAIDAFDWLELSVDQKPTPESFSLTDVYGSGAARTIQFRSLDRGVPRYLVQAASCPQWRDFTGNVLYLRHSSSAAVTLTLQRSTSRLG